MKKLNLNLIEIFNLRTFCGEVSGRLNDLKAGMKISDSVYRLDQFVEKPSPEKAKRFLKSGKYCYTWPMRIFADAIVEQY